MATKKGKGKAESPLQFDKQNCLLGKYSNNLQKWGDKDVPAWTVPVTGLVLDRTQLNRLMGDRTFESWFNQKRDGVWEPMDFWMHRNGGDFKVNDEFDIPNLEILCSGNRKAKFQAEELDDDGEDGASTRPGARITAITLKPVVGGVVEMSCHLHVLPGDPKTAENQLIQEHQRRPVKLSFNSATPVEADPKQAELPMAPGNGEPAGTSTAVSDQDAANAHAAAFNSAPPGPNEPKGADAADFKSGMERKIKENDAKKRRATPPANRPGRH